jgi:hypothetical protein
MTSPSTQFRLFPYVMLEFCWKQAQHRWVSAAMKNSGQAATEIRADGHQNS